MNANAAPRRRSDGEEEGLHPDSKKKWTVADAVDEYLEWYELHRKAYADTKQYVEGPSFVWHYRGAPHVHVWVNVSADPSVKLNSTNLSGALRRK